MKSASYGYNANGDLTSDGLRSYAYNAEGRLSDATTGATDISPTTRYAYNALGQRVFKTEPLYPPAEGDESDPGFLASLVAFFTKMWAAPLSDAEKMGYGYVYDEEGTLLAETGTGGANSGGSAQYIWLPTASGPMPVAAVVNGTDFYAVHADHLNTPRRLTDSSGQAVWQWAYSAFGDEKPTLATYRFANLDTSPNPGTTSAAAIRFNLRYPGQYFDEESGLHYNYFRSYSPASGRYTQVDPIGLDGGWNRLGYVGGNPLRYADSQGLNPVAGAAGGAAVGSAFGPFGTAVGGLIGAGAGAWIGWNVVGPMLAEKPPRGLPPEGILPPIPEADQCKPGPASRPSEQDKGGQSLWDPNGGEWRWFDGDKWHNPHWDHNPHDRKNSPWVNVPHGGLPPVKK